MYHFQTLELSFLSNILSNTIDNLSIIKYTFPMNNNITDFGIWCRKLRLDKGWSMTKAAEKLGCKQGHISQIELGKINPTIDFLEKCLKVYEMPETEKADFIAQALISSNRLTLEMDKVTIIPKEDLAKIMAVLTFNLKEPYPDTIEWKAVTKAIKRLIEGIKERSLSYGVLRHDD
jgi:transcriptional regulator with XRE-family HTH domain